MTAAIDVRRLIRIVTFLFSVVAAAIVYLSFAPQIDAASARIDAAQSQLDSDESSFSELGVLRNERDTLARRYAHLFAQNPEAVFLRGLASDVARHGVTLVATTETRDTTPQPANDPDAGSGSEKTLLSVEMRGPYRNLLAAIGELSLGPEIVRVDMPTLRRDGGDVTALVPVTIFEPTAHAPQSVSVQ
jgi:Tfp pilus assembly protein PilO